MKLKSAEFQNFRCFGEFQIDLHPELNVFIGENGSGKTAALEGIVAALSDLSGLLGIKGKVPTNKDVKVTAQGGVETGGFASCLLDDDTEMRVNFRPHLQLASDDQDIASYKSSGNSLIELRESIIRNPSSKMQLPVYAYYPATRYGEGLEPATTNRHESFSRLEALAGAGSAAANFAYVVDWLYDLYVGDLIAKDNGKEAVSSSRERDIIVRSVSSVIPEVRDVTFTKQSPRKLVLKWLTPDGTIEDRLVNQLSDGYRSMLTLVIDFARRLIQANPQLEDPLSTEAVLLIDEIDLHLHPSWQQRILLDLRKAFPNVQLVVTTHSPQVISSVEPENIYIFTNGKYERATGKHTYGVESYRVLEDLFGVSSNPEIEKISKLKNEYLSLIKNGEEQSATASIVRLQLENYIGKNAPFMINARAEINKLRRQTG